MTGFLSQMSWFDATRLTWLLAIPFVAVILVFGYRIMARRLSQAQVAVSDAKGAWHISRSLAWTRGAVFLAALSLLIVSSAGPRLGWTWIESRQSGIDMVVAMDVSKSMLAQDLDPSRLERARRMIIDLMAVAPGDRIGLAVFAGAAFVQCPLTVDHGALRLFLDGLSTDMIPVGGTDISGALRESLRALDAGGEEQGQGKLIILLTDGEEHQGDLDAAIDDVVKSKAKVITVGMASAAGSPIPDPSGGFIKDNQGNVVMSRLMDGPLKDIAAKTGGEYLDAGQTGVSVASIYENVIRAKGTVRETQARKERIWYERFQWTAGLALVLLLIEMMLREVRLGSSALSGWIVFSLIASGAFFSKPAHASDRDSYNAAVEAFNAGEADKAREAFLQIADSGSGEEKRRSLYNLANILAAAGQFEEAVKRYEAALAMNSQDQQVRDNLAWARRKAQSSPNSKKQNQDKSKQDKQEQQNQDQKNDGSSNNQNQEQNDGKKKDNKSEPSESNDQSGQKDKDSSAEQQKKSENDKSASKDGAQEQSAKQQKEQKASADSEQQQAMTPEEAEKLLRAAPDDRKATVPIFRGQKLPPRSVNKDW